MKFHYSPLSQAVAMALLASVSVIQPAMSADVNINDPITYTPGLFLPGDNLFIGDTRVGTLLINNGNQVVGQNITIGNGASDGTLTLSGVGSSLTSLIRGAVGADDINPTAEWKNSAITLIGGRSNGTVNVTDGASFVFGKLLLDGQGDKLGKMRVSGQGSSLAFIIYPDNPDFHSPANPMLFIGNSGNGELSLENGARVTFPDSAAPVIVGALQGSRGTINVSSNAVADLSPGVFQLFGDQGTANVNITSGGLLHVGGFGSVWGNADTGRATLTVSGAGSRFTTNGMAIFGGRGQAIVNIHGGSVNLTPSSTITFADIGTTSVNIDGGGNLAIGGYGSVWGNQSTANSTLTVSGAGSVFDSTNGQTTIGNVGTSVVNINAGGAWTSRGTITIGNNGTGTVNINAGEGGLVVVPLLLATTGLVP
ncbi:hypothetical protein [Yersinia ruckeri]|uniref:hypothetical protein n=1 Tax=Yersinia ruckeri TaxID=29486 RepID=UPI001F32E70A|nr:hypothetical protein [Yersinia ruckeri]UIN02617.1 hypothetical protein LGL91_18070 [Yersinia ruckeri]